MSYNLTKITKNIRINILNMHMKSCSSHIASSLSIVDLLTVLYFRILDIEPKDPLNKNRDIFILSKGHAVSALYAILAERGFLQPKFLESYCVDGGQLHGHATRGLIPGVEVSTGSLGHGLSIGIGMAQAARYDKRNSKVFVLMGDGELNEGSVWEAALFAGHHKLDNMAAIVDYNKLQAFGFTKNIIELEPLAQKWRDFKWEVIETDGHDLKQIENVFKELPFGKGKPILVIAHTIKGKGVSFMENRLEWHYKSPSKEQAEEAIKKLKQ